MGINTIGIITIHNSPNYGACLQSFALYYYLATKGYDCEIIDLARPTHQDYVASEKYNPLITIIDNPSFMLRQARKVKNFIKSIISRNWQYGEQLHARNRKFEQFNSQIRLSKRFCCIDDLYNSPPPYDVYVTGSDQVWNPGNGGIPAEPYFLTFVKNEGKKISYAPSVGVTTIPDYVKEKYREWLSSYDCISVREEEAKTLVSELTPKNVEVVLDPVFLLDISYWHSILRDPDKASQYIFCFILGKNDALLSYAKKIKSELSCELVVMSQAWKPNGINNYQFIMDAGLEEFLGWIKNAEMVLTDSFHGTAFSLLLAKNFFSYISPGNQRGCRINNLLKKFALSEHLLSSDLDQKGAELVNSRVDHNVLVRKISAEVQQSRNFLLKAIEGAGDEEKRC
nr:polysaccharide pyruvyl transferase family protein [uncultured Desulfobacter sp.]